MIDASLLPLQDDRVRLRPLRDEDAKAFAAGAEDPLVRRFAHLPAPRYSPETVVAMIAEQAAPGLVRGDLAVLAVAARDTDELVGSLVLFDVRADEAEVGFWIAPHGRGAGASSAALGLACELAVLSGLSRLTARTVADNAPSRTVLARAGFREIGIRRGTAPSGVETDLVHLTRDLEAPAITLPVETARLRLRAHIPDDAAWLHGIYARPDVARYLLEEPWTADDAARRARERAERTGLETPSGALALAIEHEGTPIGDVSLWLTDRERRLAEIGWALDPAQQGRGYAAEAVRSVLDLAFERYRVHRVVAQMDERNTASAALAAAAGMRLEAHLRADWWSKGEWTDTLVFARLRDDG